MSRVSVVGAGVVGLSCAVRLAEAGFDVDVLARDLPLETTSAVAGGLWSPDPGGSPQDALRWARATFVHLQHLAEAEQAGVRMVPGHILHRRRKSEPFWASGMSDLAALSPQDHPAAGYRFAWRVTVPLVHTPAHLAYLTRRLQAAGGTLTRMALPALPGQGLVVNCTGVASRALAEDASVQPARGQVVVTTDPGIREWWFDEGAGGGPMTYVLPRGRDVVVGGTYEDGEWSTTADPRQAEQLLERAARVVPALARATVLAHRVGLRPTRPSVRLEAQTRTGTSGAEQQIVHCYGHGTSGWTLAWGCAHDVLVLVSELTNQRVETSAEPAGEARA